MRRVRGTIVAVEKQWVLHNLSVCFCSLRYLAGNAHAPYFRMWPAPLYSIFSTLSHKRHAFEKELLNTKCVFWFSLQLLSETFLILRRNEWDMIKNVYWSTHKVPLFFSDFNETWIFSTDFRKILRYQISWKSVQWERSSMQTDRRTNVTKLIVAFRNFANAPNIIRNCFYVTFETSGRSKEMKYILVWRYKFFDRT